MRRKRKKQSGLKQKLTYLIVGFLIGVIGTFTTLKIINNPYLENTFLTTSEHVFGIDISHYQGEIDWNEVRSSHHPIEFVFIRASMGIDGKDEQYLINWEKTKDLGYIRGAYHYFRPNENSTQQFNNFSAVVKLDTGDLPPVIDIEKPSKYGGENLRKGVLNWLKLAEEHYKMKPILYTGRDFYEQYLKGSVEEYPLWIAAYSGKKRVKDISWTFHQFTEQVRVKGIKNTVDGNDFVGELTELKKMCLKDSLNSNLE